MYKIILLSAFLFVFHFTGTSQSWGDSSLKRGKLFYSAEVNPKFPGGTAGLYNFISQNLKIPQHTKVSLMLNTVTVQIIISETGKVVFAEVQPNKFLDLEKEKEHYNKAALDLIKQMPDWSPALKNGHKVRCTLSIPIVFVD